MSEPHQKLEKVLADLKGAMSGLRTGRASPALVENIAVDAYGASQPLKSLAAISVSGARDLVIQPWDKSLLPAMEKAILTSPLGVNPIADKDTIRLSLPTLTEERKRDLVRVVREKLEAVRIQVRRIRDGAMKNIENAVRAKEISEDEKFRRKQDVQIATTECNRSIGELGEAKEREIMAG